MKRPSLADSALRIGCRSATAFALLVLPLCGRAMAADEAGRLHPGARFVLEREGNDLREGYALLSALADDEAQVDKVFYIKWGNPDPFKDLIHDVAAEAQSLQKDLSSFRHGATPGGHDPDGGVAPYGPKGLPVVEADTRKAIAGYKQKRILSGTRPLFQKELLISQYEGLTYGTCLLETLAEKDANPVRSRLLRRHALAWADLRQRVFDKIPTPR
ncbi:MAG TPA: hypothetical protein VIM58_12870 [Candidatus Methylacidiphilales bacterium]